MIVLYNNEKRIKTNLLKYKVKNVAQLPEVQAKRRNTFEEKRTTLVFYQEPRINIIDGHELTVYRLNKTVADQWLDAYHPFGKPRGNVLCLGLVKDDVIYAIMTFKKSRDSQYVAELSRLWTLPTYHITDGYDILSNEASNLGLYNVIAYVNMSFENYQDYEAIGMKHLRDIQRTRWWVKAHHKISDASRRQKHLTENEMIFKGYIPVYDCGTRVYTSI